MSAFAKGKYAAGRFGLGCLVAATLLLAGCGGGDGGGDGDDGFQFSLPGLNILDVENNGPGGELVLTIELTPAAEAPLGVLAIAQQVVASNNPNVELFNDVLDSTEGVPTQNGVLELPAPVDAPRVIVVTVSGDTPNFLDAGVGYELTVVLTDGVQTTLATRTFRIDEAGPVNEPRCNFLAPVGGTLAGDVPCTVEVLDIENQPAFLTFVFSLDGGATFAPCTLVPGSSPFVGAFTPSDPANTFGNMGNQLAAVPTPSTVTPLWDSVADGVGLIGRAHVLVEVLTEDGTSASVGPFRSCGVEFAIDNSTPTQPPGGGLVVAPLGSEVLLDPFGVLGGTDIPLGANVFLRANGAFPPGSQFTLLPTAGIALALDAVTATDAEVALRIAPDGPAQLLEDTGLALVTGAHLVDIGGVNAGMVDVVVPDDLLSVSADRFTVAPGGTFAVAVQIPNALRGGLEPSVAYAADLRFDGNALDVLGVNSSTHPDFFVTPTTMAANGQLIVFVDPVGRTIAADPVISVAVVAFQLRDGVVPGTRLHVWLDATSPDNLVLGEQGTLVGGGPSLGLLGTSVLVQ